MGRKNLYLLLGDDWVSKQRKISGIKKELQETDVSVFNIDTFFADELKADTLKDALYTKSFKEKVRLLIIKRAEKLSSQNKKLIIDFLQRLNLGSILILETDLISVDKDPFLEKISKVATTLNLKSYKRLQNAFDLCYAVVQKNCALALRILSGLLDRGEKPLKILGGISWFLTNKYKPTRENIDLLLKTDTDIKTGKLQPKLALELLVIKLTSQH